MAEKHKSSKSAPDTARDDEEPIGTGTARKSLLADARLRSNMGKGLRAIYMELVREPLPQKMREILKKIDRGRK
jgi:hypothetical protein